jgi:hypothetical protein
LIAENLRALRQKLTGCARGPQASDCDAERNMATTKKWSGKVTTDSTHPPEGLFNKDAAAIARTLASKKVSPKGPASGMRMLSFYINRAGKNLSVTRKNELQHAKELLSERVKAARAKEKKRAA